MTIQLTIFCIKKILLQSQLIKKKKHQRVLWKF